MNSTVTKFKPRDFLATVLFLQVMLYVTVIFDVPIARQVVGFIYFTFVPGFIIVKLLRVSKLDWIETLLFSVGISIAFLMLGGFLINEVYFLFGISQPLSLMPLIITFNSLILIGGVLVYLRGETVELYNSDSLRISPFALLLVCLPVLSIVGAMWVNTHGDNMILLFTIISISALFIVGVLSKKLLSSKLYPFAVLMIAIAILYHSSLVSNYIVPFGSDVPAEYFLFKTTQNNAHWGSSLPSSWGMALGSYNAMLSITILPTFYANILNINSAWMFKILYPLIFSFVALGLYQIWQIYVGKKYAFVSAFLLMAQFTFYFEMLGLNRQMIAELFFVLLLFVIMNKKMKPVNKIICFMIFSFALVASHYALSAIFLFFISFTLVSLVGLKRPSRNITVAMIVFFFAVMFTWYIYTSGSAAFDSFVRVGDYVYRQIGDFFNPASRGETVLTGLGMAESPSIWNAISRMFAYFTQAFIVFGFIGLVTKRTSIRIEKEYFILCSTAMAFLVALILVPGLAETFNMTRFYHVLLFFLAPLFVVGVVFIVKLLSKREREFAVSVLVLVVLVPYFLFQTNFAYEVTGGDSWSIPLSGYRMDAQRLYGHMGYTDAYSVYGAQWLSKNFNFQNSAIYADERTAANVLTIHSMIVEGKYPLSNVTIVVDNGVVYLSTLNVVYGVVPYGQLSWNTSELSFIFDDLNLVYANGGCEVYRNKP